MAPSGSIASKYLNFPGNGIVSKGVNAVTCMNAGLIEGTNCHAVAGGLNIGSPLDPAKFPLGAIGFQSATDPTGGADPGWNGASNPGTGGDGTGGAANLGTVADIANFITASSSNYKKNQYNGRVDADITSKDRIGAAIYWVPQSTNFNNGARGYDIFHHHQVNNAFSAIWNHTFSPSLLNEFRVNAAGWRWNEVSSNPQSPVGLPAANIDTIGSVSLSSVGPNVGSILNQWTYTYKDVATKIVGPHTIKFGGEITRLFYLNDCAGCGVPSYNFFNLWDFLNDVPHNEGGGFNPNTGFPTTLRQDDRTDIWGFFAQDDYKIRRNLTVNLGLRWSYFGPLSSKEGNMYVATPGAGANYLTDLTVHKGQSWTSQKNNLGPEVGLAWSPTRFHDRLVVRGGYGLNYNQEEIAISANVGNNPGLVVFPSLSMSTPNAVNPGIIYATSSDPHNLTGYPENSNTKSCFANGLPVACPGQPTPSAVGVSIFPNTLPTMRVHHYSLDTQYDLGQHFVMTLGYQGTRSRNIYFHQNPNATPAAQGYALNPQIGGGDYWSVLGYGNYNALLAELKHDFSHQFMADAQFTWAKSLDTSSSPYSAGIPPYSEPYYPYNPGLNYGRSDYNVSHAFKLFGMWQPVLFHGNNKGLEKIAGGWSLSGIFNWHSGFPWTPFYNLGSAGSLYCGQCGYGNLPAVYLGGAGTSTSNDQFKNGSNFPNGPAAYFAAPNFTAYQNTAYGNALPQVVRKNTFNGPGYRAVDLTLAKGFGLPKLPGLGENAKFEFRMDVYNLFNNLNFNPTSISANIGSGNFGQATSALGGRVVTLGARFSF